MRSWEVYGVARYASLGVVPADISPQVAERFELSTTEGALVEGDGTDTEVTVTLGDAASHG